MPRNVAFPRTLAASAFLLALTIGAASDARAAEVCPEARAEPGDIVTVSQRNYWVTETGAAGSAGQPGEDALFCATLIGDPVEPNDTLGLRLRAHAGDGGDAVADGAGGLGGGALTAVVLGNVAGRGVDAEVEAYAGNGGDGRGEFDGGDGGRALLTAASRDDRGDYHQVEAWSRGGNGGDAHGTGDGGDGGRADVRPITVRSSADGPVKAGVTVIGGSGGNALAGGSGGTGASVRLNNAVRGSTTRTAKLFQRAIGGDGGSADARGRPGAAGKASARLWAVHDNENVDLTSVAQGGDGGALRASNGRAGDGADAQVHVLATNLSGSASADGAATGGDGGNGLDGARAGHGGDASAVFVEFTLGDGVTSGPRFGSSFHPYPDNAVGGRGGDAGGDEQRAARPGTGGSARTTSFSVAAGDSQAISYAGSKGGDGGSVLEAGRADGAHGGDASASSLAISAGDFDRGSRSPFNVSSQSWVTGGDGGDGRGDGYRGGDGGAASAWAHGESTAGGRSRITVLNRGGAAGSGFDGADAGAARDVTLHNVPTGGTLGALLLAQTAWAGDGGDAYGGGIASRGGDALASFDEPIHARGGALELVSAAIGGDGGDARPAVVDPNAVGGRGGAARADGSDTVDGERAVNLSLRASGGNGGAGSRGGAGGAAVASADAETRGSENIRVDIDVRGGEGGVGTSRGGNGGAASLGRVRAHSETGDIRVQAIVAGGHGGDSPHLSTAPGGDGASVRLDNAFDIATTGIVSAYQAARGGDAGNDRSVFQAGPASRAGAADSALRLDMHAASLSATTHATGGAGARTSGSVQGGHGGTAKSTTELINRAGPVSANTYALGGRGGNGLGADALGGHGGNATGLMHGETYGDGNDVEISNRYAAVTGARGGDGGDATTRGSIRAEAGRGGDARSRAVGIAQGDSTVTVYDYAWGGYGGDTDYREGSVASAGAGGDAQSNALARNQGASRVSAAARAEGGGAGSGGPTQQAAAGGSASANATAESTGTDRVTSDATAIARDSGNAWANSTAMGPAHAAATAHAQTNSHARLSQPHGARAIADARGTTGIAVATAQIVTPLYYGVEARAVTTGNIGGVAAADVAVGSSPWESFDAGGIDAFVTGTLQPGALATLDAFMGSENFDAPLVDTNLLMQGAVGFSESGRIDFTFDFNVHALKALGSDIVAGFSNVELDATGFERLSLWLHYDGRYIVSEVFEDAAVAVAFLEGRLFDLGTLTSDPTSSARQQLGLTMRYVGDGGHFAAYTLFALTTPAQASLGAPPILTPEPGTATLLLAGLVVTCLHARASRRARTFRTS